MCNFKSKTWLEKRITPVIKLVQIGNSNFYLNIVTQFAFFSSISEQSDSDNILWV